MKFPEGLDQRFKELGLDPHEVYSSSVSRCILVNTMKTSVEAIRKLFSKDLKGVPWCPEAFLADEDQVIKDLFGKGLVYIQDAASLIPVLALDLRPGLEVLDMCAAPGTKTIHVAMRLGPTGRMVVNESYRSRSYRLRGNLRTFGVSDAQVVSMDARRLGKKFLPESFDRVLLDPPCSGEGMIRKAKKVFQIWSEKRISRLATLQKKMIEVGFNLLRPGGLLVYSTCTFELEENEEVANHLVRKFPNVKIETIELAGLKAHAGFTHGAQMEYHPDLRFALRIYPQDHGTNGFFVARIRKV